MASECPFCQIAAGARAAAVVFDDSRSLAFLDSRPVFPGHCLLIPRVHIETLTDLPMDAIGPLFANARRLALSMESGLGAEGAFVAVNHRVSQSVPHLHIHVVPRKRKDGLRGFFWPRGKYASSGEQEAVRARLAAAFAAVASPA
jgi:histidine triad (HIT) family protein